LPLASRAEPSGHVVVRVVCCFDFEGNADDDDDGGRAFEGGGGGVVEGGCANPADGGSVLPKPVLLEGEVSLQSILFPPESYSHV
jgi:hypothetical protein